MRLLSTRIGMQAHSQSVYSSINISSPHTFHVPGSPFLVQGSHSDQDE